MKKTHKKRSRSGCFGMEATTTSRDWGFIPIPGKGGKTTNCKTSESMFFREKKEMGKN